MKFTWSHKCMASQLVDDVEAHACEEPFGPFTTGNCFGGWASGSISAHPRTHALTASPLFVQL